MKPSSPASGTVSSLADRLETLAAFWQEASRVEAMRPRAVSPLDAQRDAWKALADEAENGDHGGLARALRRLALLSEVWECLESEPGQGEAAAEVAAFCLRAMRRLARDPRTGTGRAAEGVCDEILRESQARWSDYLSPVDPTEVDPPVTEEPVPFDAPCIPQDDDPPALDSQTLLRLFQGSGSDGGPSAPPGPRAEPQRGSASRRGPSAEAEPSARARTGPESSLAVSRPEERIAADRLPPKEDRHFQDAELVSSQETASQPIPASPETGPRIPPLPRQWDLDDEMREAFLEDVTDLFERIEKTVLGLNGRDDPRAAVPELARCLHTLKGAAGSVGLNELATLVHELEDRLGQAGAEIPPGLIALLHQVVGYLDELIGLLRRGTPALGRTTGPPPSRSAPVLAPTSLPPDFSAIPVRPITEPSSTTRIPPEEVAPLEVAFPDEGWPEKAGADSKAGWVASAKEAAVPTQAPAANGPIRVSAARFDELMDLASELILQGRFWLSQVELMKTFAATAQACRNHLLGSLDRLHDVDPGRPGCAPALIDPEADWPVQLRRLAEQADDLAVLARSAQAAACPMAHRADTLVRLSLQLWDSFQSLRIVPIRGLFQRLARALYEAARVEGRQVEVLMLGEELGVDRAVQDKTFEPLLHVVRNAVGHGIEAPADRVRAGKPATGRVTLEARHEGNTLVIAVADDGKGLDGQAIAEKARRLGWIGPAEVPTHDQLQAFIFQPGFSTKSQAGAISGRGVGMDVVAREVGKLRGTVDLTSQPGRGTRLTLRFPARLALEPALIVRVGGQSFAVPASQVELAQPFEPLVPSPDGPHEPGPVDSASTPLEGRTVAYGDQAVPVVFGREILGIGDSSAPAWPKLVLVRGRSRLVGLVVDTIEGAEKLVVQPLGALLVGHPLVSGSSLSINGEVISVLNPVGLERWLALGTGPAASCPAHGPQAGFAGDRMAALVVDDSLSVRRGLARQLRGLGLAVDEVADGLEALGRLRSSRYELVLTDLDMPKLDGFALLAEIQRSTGLARVPVLVASSRGDAETRRRVRDLGAQALISKPVDPKELARVVQPLLPAVKG